MLFFYVLTIVSLLLYSNANPINGPALPKSPCPDIVKYDSVDGQGRLDATLLVRSPHVLHGLWIRVLFDQDIDSLTVKDGFGEVETRNGNRGFLIKNPDLELQSNEERLLKITVAYSGSQIPNIIEYRINAVTICPNARSNGQLYPNDELVPSDYLPSITANYQKTSLRFQCGQSDSADFFPWHASIFSKQNDSEHYTCEATLISPKHVLTAAHCVTYLRSSYSVPSSSLKIYFGKHTLDQPETPYLVKRVSVYPGYQPENLLNDIAIVELDESITNKKISPVCLPEEPISIGQQVLSGYSIEKEQFTKLTTTTVERIDNGHCLKKLSDLGALLGDAKYCVAYLKNNGLCVGDSGSGSVILASDRWILQGVLNVGVSLQGQQTCDESSKLILTEIYQYSKWIDGKISEQ